MPGSTSAEAESRARSLFAGLPLMFEPNQGQGNLDASDPRAKFVARGSGYSLFLGSEGAILSMVSQERSTRVIRSASLGRRRVDSIQMKLVGANPNATVTGADLLPGKSNYFIGNDPAKWRTGVPQFARVRYDDVYPGIDLVFYGNQGRLEYDFQVKPGSDPAQAELEFNGAKQLELKDGDLVIRGENGQRAARGSARVSGDCGPTSNRLRGSFVLRGAKRAGIRDRSLRSFARTGHRSDAELLHLLRWQRRRACDLGCGRWQPQYLPGGFDDLAESSCHREFRPRSTARRTYISRRCTPPLGSLAAVLDYVTYLGGDGTDTPVGIEVDGAGNPFVAGTTSSTNFPTTATNAYQAAPSTHRHACIRNRTAVRRHGAAVFVIPFRQWQLTPRAA